MAPLCAPLLCASHAPLPPWLRRLWTHPSPRWLLRLRSTLCLRFPTPSPDAGTAPSQEGQASSSAANAAPAPSQEGRASPSDGPAPTQVGRAKCAPQQISVARASLIALYTFFEPAILAQGRMIAETDIPAALGAALKAYGVSATSSWLRDATCRISADAAALSVGSLPQNTASSPWSVPYTHLTLPTTSPV